MNAARTPMTRLRALVALVAVVVALVLQVSLFPHLAWQGVVPNLCLLVVVAAGLTSRSRPRCSRLRGGFALDLAPPADNVAGRWALALTIVGYLAGGSVRTCAHRGGRRRTVAAASFVGTSIFALSGMLLRDPGRSPSR